MNKYILLVILLVVGIVVYLLLIHNKTNVTSMKENMGTSDDMYTHCNMKCYGSSVDSVIICSALSSLKATPRFYFENVTGKSVPSDWIYVNLASTNFSELNNTSAPNWIACKTMQAYKLLSSVFPVNRLIYTGFTSIDRYDGTINKDYNSCLHVAGKSNAKGTILILTAWLKHPEWPHLTIVVQNELGNVTRIQQVMNESKNTSSNIKVIDTFIENRELDKLMNTCGVHICISEYEDFGHTGNEARSVAAVTLYTNTPCLNERFVNNISGIAVTADLSSKLINKYCPTYNISVNNIEIAIARLLAMSLQDKIKIGTAARIQYLEDTEIFNRMLIEAINGPVRIPKIIHSLWLSKDAPFDNVDMPEKYDKYQQSIISNNQDFRHMYWSGNSILKLIQEHFPEHLSFYTELTPVISKCDFARFAIVAVHGGMYMDADFMVVKNISELLTGNNYFINELKYHGVENLFNGIFAACPQDPFVLGWLKAMKQSVSTDVFSRTGPVGLYKYYLSSKDHVLLGNTCDVMSILNNYKTAIECQGYYNSYTSTTWHDGSNWGGYTFGDPSSVSSHKNVLDDGPILWETSEFTKNNWPDLNFEIDEKKEIFSMALKNLPGFGVIDVGAHIGDLAVPLAQALQRAGRGDVNVFACDPSSAKCDFIHKMKLFNGIHNLHIINVGLSDKESIFTHDNTNDTNTGAQIWKLSVDSTKQVLSTDTHKSEVSKFVTADSLLDKFGPIGLYHIDVECHELSVLRGSKKLINLYRPIISMETYNIVGEKCPFNMYIQGVEDPQCKEIYTELQNMNPSYKITRKLSNNDLVFEPVK